jgi:uncharacterized damage-inducible protein DinB
VVSALPRPGRDEYGAFYAGYVDAMPDCDVREHLRSHGVDVAAWIESLSEAQGAQRYAEGKWSVKQVLGHALDCERLYAHRALCIARGDPADQPPMDEKLWMAGVDFDTRTLASLAQEHRAVRGATSALFATFDASVGNRRGRANGNPFSVRALVWITAGHELHHHGVLRDRYGLKPPPRH